MSHASRQIHGPCQVVVGLDDDFLSSPEARAINKNQTFVSWQNTCVKREVKKRHLKVGYERGIFFQVQISVPLSYMKMK